MVDLEIETEICEFGYCGKQGAEMVFLNGEKNDDGFSVYIELEH